ncbi:hypothetical protein QBC40DRAFT_285674 [Triangularia verruculosa]|uniref:AB hydrolase-1 domain-containing protein n=1 Tax=Triangularia verruculosa TaxID=2587418 RepID=A0AAN6XBU0_9PEZI|nr:hypothetical protein QBC40DRAFT_285674 [Triangularia verruculosa]
MLSHSLINLIFIRLGIFLLENALFIELSLLILTSFKFGLSPLSGSTTAIILKTSLLTLCTLEISSLTLLYLPHKTRLLNSKAIHPSPPLTQPQRQALFQQCTANVPEWNHYIRLWFLNAPLSEIKRQNIRDFILWGFFDSDSAAPLSQEIETEIEGYITQIEALSNHHFPPGRGNATTALRLTFDPIETRYRSVIWYLIVCVIDAATHFTLSRHGFTHHRPSFPAPPPPSTSTVSPKIFHSFPPPVLSHLFPHHIPSPSGHLSYYLRPHRSPIHKPVIFLHGIGIGLYPYPPFLLSLPEDVGILILENLPYSARLTSPPLSKSLFLSELSSILSHLPEHWNEFTLVTHSYGSVLATHILCDEVLSPKVTGLVLVDPVTILLHLPDVAYNFTRRAPKRANEWQLWYFASMDLGVGEGLGRHFFWRENIIWREDLTKRRRDVAVVLSGQDLIVDTRTVARYLACDEGNWTERIDDGWGTAGEVRKHKTGDGIEILWFPELDHAQVFEHEKECKMVGEVVERYCLASGKGNKKED